MLATIDGKELIENLATTMFEECLRQGISSQEIDEILNRVAMKVVETYGVNEEDFYE